MTDQTGLTEQLERCEGLMLQGQDEQAAELLAHLAEDAEEYVDKNCPTTDELQWFSFPTLFERLAYRRVEKDPRELRSVGEPLDRLYNDLALANVHVGDYDAAAAALFGTSMRIRSPSIVAEAIDAPSTRSGTARSASLIAAASGVSPPETRTGSFIVASADSGTHMSRQTRYSA